MDLNVTATADRKGKKLSYTLTLEAEVFEVDIHIPGEEAEELKLVASSRWEDGSMQIGEAAGAPVFWSTDDGMVAILIGDDDENWDIALSMPVETMDRIIQAVASA
ncbi:MAG TPA: hypothetical protein VFA75_15840 [Nevskia sp.]|nr:hypothetical protein [Nevskia sp.]